MTDNSKISFSTGERLTTAQKERNQKQWFKKQLDSLDIITSSSGGFFYNRNNGEHSEYDRMQSNYDLFNNKINKSDFAYVCQPFGREIGEMPAEFNNKDIVSGKVKALLGMEMNRPFAYKSIAINSEATTRREQEEFNMIREYVVSEITKPIRAKLEQEAMAQTKGRELTEEEQQQVRQQVEEQMKAMTPEEVKLYMEREHQDPAEVLSRQILEYLIKVEDIPMKFNKGWKHSLISGKEVYWIGSIRGNPVLKIINPLRFDYDRSSEVDYIEDSEWACHETFMSPTDIIKVFGDEFTAVELEEIMEDSNTGSSLDFSFRSDSSKYSGIRVFHGEWKSLKPIKFLKYIDNESGAIEEILVDESYKLNKEAGDLELITEWIPTKYEGYRIGKDKYAFLREVPGQHTDMNKLWECKLSYVGAVYDNMNSTTTSLVDRMKFYQYLYNIIWYRIELLAASDKGKAILLNANLIPKSSGLDVEKWLYMLEANKLGLLNPNEEGNRGADIASAVKEVDMSMVSDIQKYIQLLEYIEKRCGESVGITKQVEGQISSQDAVRNTQQALIQSANILEPYFEVHNNIKRNVLQILIDTAKSVYSESQPSHLSYVLDDMSVKLLQIDYDLLENSTYGIFVSNSMKSDQALQMVQQLSHAAMQNQKIELSDVIKIMKSDSIQEAEELLKKAEKERIEREQQMQQQQIDAQQKEAQAQREWQEKIMDKQHAHKMEEIQLKGELDLQEQAMLSVGFNEDKDLDKDGVPDVLEIYKAGADVSIKERNLKLQEDKLEQQKKEHEDNVKLENKKIESQILKNKVSTK